MSPALAGRFFPTGATFRRNKPGKARRKGPECTKQRREPLTDVRDFRANGRKRQNVDSEAGSKGTLLDCFSSFSLKSQVRLTVEGSVSGREA